MINILSIVNAVILALLGVLHLYWAVGGQWAADNALPKKASGERLFTPKAVDCIAVAMALTIFALFFLIHALILNITLPNWLWQNGLWFLGGIFLLRAVGDFRYVGFTKKIKNNTFASMDTTYYSPLCLYLALSSFWINITV